MKAILLAPLLLAGCAAPIMHIPVDSSPQGARVFFASGANESFANTSRGFIGTTPFTWDYQPKGDGTFDLPHAPFYNAAVPAVAVFTVEPPEGQANLFPARQVFHGGTIATPGDRVPTGLFFDLHKKSQ